ncbi:MAG: hypothetical protein AVDCRST_MAG72-1242, partial [uncultured Nocardioidaceae bacterium]
WRPRSRRCVPGKPITTSCACSPSTSWRCSPRRHRAARSRYGSRRTPSRNASRGPGTRGAIRRPWSRWTQPPGSRWRPVTWSGRRPSAPVGCEPPASAPTSARCCRCWSR